MLYSNYENALSGKNGMAILTWTKEHARKTQTICARQDLRSPVTIVAEWQQAMSQNFFASALMHQIEDRLPGLALRFRDRLAGKHSVVGVDAILQAGIGLNGGLGPQSG